MKRIFRLSRSRPDVPRDVRDEIGQYIELRTQEFIERGMPPDEARRAALEAFGDVAAIEAECRHLGETRTRAERRSEVFRSILQDLRYAARSFRRAPGYTFVVVLTLALGIGANTAIFSLINGVLLRPLPFEGGERVVHVSQPVRAVNVPDAGLSPLEVADYRSQSRTLEGMVEYHSMPFILIGKGEPQRVQTGVVSADFFKLLGVQPLLGRTFTTDDDRPGAEAVLVLSYEHWQRAYGGDPEIVGRTFTMNDRVHTVIGVLPSIPQYPGVNDVYMPVHQCPFRSGQGWSSTRVARGLTVLARTKPGATIPEVRSDLAAISARLHAEYPDAYPKGQGLSITAESLRDQLTRGARPTLLLLLGASGFLLLIVCANVANLSLARLIRREREMALRTALGAGRARILQQLVTESTFLALVGGALGLVLAAWGLDVLKVFIGRFTTRAAEVGIDRVVLAFTFAIAVITGVVLGALPALPRRLNVASDLKDGVSKTTAGGGQVRLRNMLVVSQVAVSFVLLIGAGLMLRSFLKLQRVDPGFDPQNVLSARVDLSWSKYNAPPKIRAFSDRLLAELSAVPGVTAVAATNIFPLNGSRPFLPGFDIEGRPTSPGETRPNATFHAASPGYFATMGIPLVRGRTFTEADGAEETQVAAISQTLAERYWPGEEPLGRRVSFDDGKSWATIVGIVSDVRQAGLDSAPSAEIYMPFAQAVWRDMRVLARTRGDVATLGRQLEEIVRRLDSEQPVVEVRTLEEVRSESLASPRVTTTLIALFAALALVVTATGIAGVVAFAVSQRTTEIGIRIALGAERREMLAMVLRQGMLPVAVGLGLGVLGALALARALAGLLFDVGATDPLTFAAVGIVLASVALGACWAPARRATAVDPMIALRAG